MEQGPCARLLGLIETVRLSGRDVSLTGVVLFLHVCEHDGIAIKDLVYLSGLSESLVSRAVDRLQAGGRGEALVTVVRHPEDGRRRLIHLTDAGLKFKTQIARAFAGLPDDT